jgi:hypothetical protein
MAIYRVAASRTEFFTIEGFFRVSDEEEAERAFYMALEAGGGALQWTHAFDGADTEIDAVEDVSRSHDPDPSDIDRRVCRLCGRPVRWTGIAAEDSPTGRTVPGPWLHIENLTTDEGIGL